jgi:hypothetical protein
VRQLSRISFELPIKSATYYDCIPLLKDALHSTKLKVSMSQWVSRYGRIFAAPTKFAPIINTIKPQLQGRQGINIHREIQGTEAEGKKERIKGDILKGCMARPWLGHELLYVLKFWIFLNFSKGLK